MKAFLMYQDRDLDRGEKASTRTRALERDLDLGRVCTAMAASDRYL